jgi:hypothetical protein
VKRLVNACLVSLLSSVLGAGLSAVHGDARGTTTLALDDGSVFVIGAVGAERGQRAALWRFRSDGVPDMRFGAGGMLVASEAAASRGLSIQQSVDGVVHIAVQSDSGGSKWLEVHRWKAGTGAPLRVARQRPAEDWVGPAFLAKRGTDWVWLDGSRPQALALELVTVPRDSPWASAASMFESFATKAESVALPSQEEAVQPVGHAVLNPYSGSARRGMVTPPSIREELAWHATLLMILVAPVGGLLWWWRRNR